IFPRNWRRLADSKSNSSTRLPRTTTTRVSSGWVASISILLAIDESLFANPASGRAHGRRHRRQAPRGRRGGRGGSWEHAPGPGSAEFGLRGLPVDVVPDRAWRQTTRSGWRHETADSLMACGEPRPRAVPIVQKASAIRLT